MKNVKSEFTYGRVYHVFNRSNNREKLFKETDNKLYFLSLCRDKLKGYMHIHAYALLENHFHLAIAIKEKHQILDYIVNLPTVDKRKADTNFLNSSELNQDINGLIRTQFSRVFNSYSQAINKRYNRKGNLFNHSVKRSIINSEPRFANLIYYIHHNSRKHGIYKNFINVKWHSYHEIIDNSSDLIEYKFVLNWFGGLEAFKEYHQGKYLEKDFHSFWIE